MAHFYYFTPNKRGVLSCRNLQNPNLTLLSDPSFGNSSSPTSQRKTVSLQSHTENSKVHVYSTIAWPPLPRHAKVIARLSNGYEAPNPFLVRERLTSHAARLRRLIIINSRPEPACTFQTRAWPIKSTCPPNDRCLQPRTSVRKSSQPTRATQPTTAESMPLRTMHTDVIGENLRLVERVRKMCATMCFPNKNDAF